MLRTICLPFTVARQHKWKILIGVAAFVGYGVTTAFNPSPPATLQQIKADDGKGIALDDNRVMEYFEYGAVDSTNVIVALHGAQTTGKLYQLLDDWATTNNVRIVAPTLPGFGLTTHFPPGTAVEEEMSLWTSDMKRLLLGELKLKRFHLTGASLGSIYAIRLATALPADVLQNVELYVAFAPAGPDHDPLKGSILKMFADMEPHPWRKRLFDKFLIIPMLSMMGGDLKRSLATQWEGLASCSRIIYHDWNCDWKGLTNGGKRKVIIVSGTKDAAAPPPNQHKLHQEIVGSRLIEFDGPHEGGITNPKMWGDHMSALLK